jgi:hypothetical protein
MITLALTLTTTDGDRWTITHTTTALITTTILVPAIYSVPEALLMAAPMASGDVLWRLTEGPVWLGFEADIRTSPPLAPDRLYTARHATPVWSDTAADTARGRVALRRLVATTRARTSTTAVLWATASLGLAWLLCVPGWPLGPVLALTLTTLAALTIVAAVTGAGVARDGRGAAGRAAAGSPTQDPPTEPLRILIGG